MMTMIMKVLLSHSETTRCDLLAVASLTFHQLDCQHMEDVLSVMLDRLHGTLFLSVSRTMHKKISV